MQSSPALPEDRSRERSISLVVAGALMVAAGFLLANPSGATDTRWPWQILSEWPWTRRHANWGLWYLAAALAVALGLKGRRCWRAPLLLGLALLLLITCCSGQAGLALIQNNLGWFAGVALLGAGLLLEAEGRRPRAARGLCLLGGFMVVWTLAAFFGKSPEGPPTSYLSQILGDMATRIRGSVVADARPNYDIELFSSAAALLAALLGLLTVVGVRGGLVARIGLVLILLYFLVPTFHALGIQVGARLALNEVFRTLSEVLIHSGLALTLLLAATVADMARLEVRPA